MCVVNRGEAPLSLGRDDLRTVHNRFRPVSQLTTVVHNPGKVYFFLDGCSCGLCSWRSTEMANKTHAKNIIKKKKPLPFRNVRCPVPRVTDRSPLGRSLLHAFQRPLIATCSTSPRATGFQFGQDHKGREGGTRALRATKFFGAPRALGVKFFMFQIRTSPISTTCPRPQARNRRRIGL